MAQYRIRWLQMLTPGQRETFEADDDQEAIELVRLRIDPRPCELWLGGRKVAVLPPEGGAPVLTPSTRLASAYARAIP
jgi:hypothetical protein